MFKRKLADVMIMPAVKEDLVRIEELHALAFPRGWSRSELMGMFDQEGTVFLVARHVGKPKLPVAGFNIIRQTLDEAEIISVAVDPTQRGLHIGDALMRKAINHGVTDRLISLFLEVAEDNLAAVSLYKKLGFAIVGNRPAYYQKSTVAGDDAPKDRITALVMRLDLS